MKPVSLSSLLGDLVRNPQMARNQRLVQLQKQWAKVVGEAVAAHCRPLKLQDAVLTVAVSGAVWAQNLGYQRRLLMGKIAEIWGAAEPLRDIRFETTGWYAREKTGRVPLAPEHPLIVPLAGHPAPAPGAGPPTLQDRLERLRTLARWRGEQLPECPRCRMGAPRGELVRWGMCGSCAVRP
ncbi:DUF721 domain-containing protein [Gloeobacter violaceus]|uniref:Gll1579 protein n=1 Tax=Gloeobacter violaceus (strain ATCC 29082 / PCC 7421) TaxID=251221 RepID=Q7NK99_GLOVI|nr:DUF721 domain-containing protein [Gloeobacter violaceus]BAC89520.1 gll1579 [Gloeobacter violaceus PCC 7421]